VARGRVGLEVEDELLELLDCAKDVEGFDILKCGFEVVPEGSDTSVAALELSEVVITYHSVKETSGHLGDHQEIKLRDYFRSFGLNWTNSDGNEVGGSLSGFEILAGSPVNFDVIEVCHDLILMENHVFRYGGDDISLGFKDLGPCFDGGDIVIHAFASSKNGGETSNDGFDILGSLEEGFCLNVFDYTFNLGNNTLSIGGAELDLGEMVVSNHTVKKTTKEEEWGLNGHVRNGFWFNGTNSEGKSISGVLASLEVGLSSPVGLLLSNVSLDLGAVEEPVFSDGRSQGCRLSEDLSPGFNGGDVVSHTLAGCQ